MWEEVPVTLMAFPPNTFLHTEKWTGGNKTRETDEISEWQQNVSPTNECCLRDGQRARGGGLYLKHIHFWGGRTWHRETSTVALRSQKTPRKGNHMASSLPHHPSAPYFYLILREADAGKGKFRLPPGKGSLAEAWKQRKEAVSCASHPCSPPRPVTLHRHS